MMDALLSTPLFGLVLCISTFLVGRWIQNKTGWVLANPVLIASALCITFLLLLDIPYESFALGGDILHMMLGPATAVLALGIYNQRAVLKQYFVPVLLGCTAGSTTSIFSILGLCRLFRLDDAITMSLISKSCTTAIALSITDSHGGLTAVTAFSVMLAGVTGCLGAPLFCKWFRITDPVAQGLATGACSHALGTTKAREMGELQGAMSSIAIGVCGLISVGIAVFL